MNIEEFQSYCLQKKGVTEELPFGPDTLVYKVMGKVFALASLDDEASFNLKCNPERSIELREQYDAIIPGYHMNKTHWNTVYGERGLDDSLIRDLITHSYELVLSGLPLKIRKELENQ